MGKELVVQTLADIMVIDNNQIAEILSDTFDDPAFEKMSAHEIERIKKYVLRMSCGSSAYMALICRGSLCIYRSSCVLLRKDSNLPAPEGKECPFEKILAKKWFDDYRDALNIDVNDRVEASQINDLIEIEIMKSRINAILAEEGIKIDAIVGIDPDTGSPLTAQQQHYAINIKDINDRRKDRILKALLATRESKTAALGKRAGDITAMIQKAMSVYNNAHNATLVAEEIKNESNKALEQGGFEESSESGEDDAYKI